METQLTDVSVQKNLIESALFMATKPLSLDELMRISGIGSLGYLKGTIKELQKDHEEKSLEIIETPEGWQMKVKKEYLPRVASLTPHADLSEGCKKTLALVLYHEPLKQSELIKTQGTKAYIYVKELEKRGLLRGEPKGHTKILKVTTEFENYFGETKELIKKRLVEAMESMDIAEPAKTAEPAGETETEEPAIKASMDYLESASLLTQGTASESIGQKTAKPPPAGRSIFKKKTGQKKPEQLEAKLRLLDLTEDDEALPFLSKRKATVPKETKNLEKNLKPIKRERPIKIKIKREASGSKREPQEKKTESKPINKVVAKQDLSGVKELTVDDLKK